MSTERQLAFYRADIASVLKNLTCPYCGHPLISNDWNTEHVIGRKFVPKGTLNKHWNLILRACKRCNGYKSDLEDDIGAISMQPNSAGKFVEDDPVLSKEAKRRAKSFSRKTRRTVSESAERFQFRANAGPGITLSGNFVGPPQIEDRRLFELARLQLAGFFYALTYNQESNKGGFWVEGFHPLLEAVRSDWGNVIHTTFMSEVKHWEPRLLAETASGYYKVAIRRHPGAECWSWALEWNRNYRVIGFFGDRAAAQVVMDRFPPLPRMKIVQNGRDWVAVRPDVSLDTSKDLLFVWDGAVTDAQQGAALDPKTAARFSGG